MNEKIIAFCGRFQPQKGNSDDTLLFLFTTWYRIYIVSTKKARQESKTKLIRQLWGKWSSRVVQSMEMKVKQHAKQQLELEQSKQLQEKLN